MLENGSTIVKQFYEEDAAIRDLSKQNEILELVFKLNSVLFASTIDNPILNSFKHSANHYLLKGRRIDNQTDYKSDSDDQRQSKQQNTQAFTNQTKPIAVRQQKQNENDEKASLNSSLSRTNSSKADLNLPLSRNSSYSSNYQQDDLDDKSDDNEAINSNILLTPIVAGNYSVTDQFMTTNYEEDEKASDFSNQSCNTSCSSTPAFHSKELANFERTKRLFDNEFESMSKHSTDADLKGSSQGRKLFTASPDQLEQDERVCKLESQNEQLKNENKQLKLQLKKYIEAIFKCANNTDSSSITIDDVDLSDQIRERTSLTKNNVYHHKQTTTTQDASGELDYKQQIKSDFNTNAYLNYRDSVEHERKLVQVAEMFGEIVEYNDRLNRVLMQKDATIKVLKDQLVELRGPVSLLFTLFPSLSLCVCVI